MSSEPQIVTIDKLVHGGQALGILPDGRKVLVWNALPGETVEIELRKSKHSFAEGIATRVINASPDREEPRDEAYLSTSPWQIMNFEAEQKAKVSILRETFAREHVTISREVDEGISCVSVGDTWQYRNKMEYSFWGDDDGLHLALFHRASHGKRIITGSSIARPEIDKAANEICRVLNKAGIRGSQLKTVVLRCNMAGETVAALYVKDEAFPEIRELKGIAKGIAVYFSNPKSPASIYTKTVYEYGDVSLTETVIGKQISYDVRSFFQVNMPVFEAALGSIKEYLGDKPVTDFYSGVGTIGIPLGADVFVESEKSNIERLKLNLKGTQAQVIEAPAENALEQLPSKGTLIVDPPRAGLHAKVTETLNELRPPRQLYILAAIP